MLHAHWIAASIPHDSLKLNGRDADRQWDRQWRVWRDVLPHPRNFTRAPFDTRFPGDRWRVRRGSWGVRRDPEEVP